eukprot:806997-Pelagomonas_calceolata.AAC.1
MFGQLVPLMSVLVERQQLTTSIKRPRSVSFCAAITKCRAEGPITASDEGHDKQAVKVTGAETFWSNRLAARIG